MCVNYKSKIIKQYFGDGHKFGVKIEYIQERIKMGTAGSLSLFKEKPKEPFFVINGDLLTNLDFDKMLNFHTENNSKATMCLSEYNIESPYGEVKLDRENITLINEKPIHKFFVNAGIYMLSPEVLKFIPKNEFYNMTTLFEKLISKDINVISYPIKGYWLDIGRFEEYKRANEDYEKVF